MAKKPVDEERLMTLAELAGYLHMGRKTVLDLAARQEIPGVLIAGEWRFRRKAIDEWLDGQSSGRDDDFAEVMDGMRLPLGDLLPDEAIIHEMRAKDALGAIEELAARAYQNRWLNDKPWFVGALVEREALASTAMEGGVAFLHTRARDTGKIARPFIIVGRSYGGIDFGSPDGSPTNLFFLLGLKHDRLHLPILGRLARLVMRHPKTVGKLRATTSPVKMRNTLLQLDAEALSAAEAQKPFDFAKAREPRFDRDIRLRAIKRLTARRNESSSEAAKAAKAAKTTAKAAAKADKAAKAKPATGKAKGSARKPPAKKK